MGSITSVRPAVSPLASKPAAPAAQQRELTLAEYRQLFTTKEAVLEGIYSQQVPVNVASVLLAELTPAPAAKALHCKVSQKGAVSVYGLQRMPVTLYAEQWGRLLEFGESIKQFVRENRQSLSFKAGADASAE